MEKMLLIAPVFFNYYKAMINKLIEMGYSVDYVCDAPSNSNISKAIGRINKNLIRSASEKHFDSAIRSALKPDMYDVVLVVGGMTFAFSADRVQELRQMQSKAKFVLYQWDSEKNLPYSTKIHPYFDEIYTFDRQDALRDKKYRMLPLFYTDIYKEIGTRKTTAVYDCMYVGTAHPFKYRDINVISDAVKDVAKKQYICHYMPSKLKFWYQKILSPAFRKTKSSDMTWNKVSEADLMRIMDGSRCVLDAPQEGQTGLTIRTIECLGAKRKLITTNQEIKYYDFYNPNNIWIYEAGSKPPVDFFTSPYVDLDEDIYEKYSLESWLRTMITNGEEKLR